VYTAFLFTQGRGRGGELTSEKVRVAKVHIAGRKYQHDRLYLQSINSIETPVKTTFRVWCLYSYIVHACCTSLPGRRFEGSRNWRPISEDMKKLYTARVTTFIYIDEGNGSPDEYSF
jgi:uncharacterized protein (UPF0276 family)